MNVTAPYNFVPLSSAVCKATDLGLTMPPSQDKPEPDSQSGSIAFTVSCDTPILVNWAEPNPDKIKRFGCTPDGTPAIPGSTLRGMIRNVLEIASFGKMALADDARTSVRDLNPTANLDYGSKVSTTVGGAYRPLAQAGWLRMEGSALMLTPCEFARIDHRDLEVKSPGFHVNVRKSDIDATEARVVQEVYTGHENAPGLVQRLYVENSASSHKHSLKNEKKSTTDFKHLYYRKAAFDQSIAGGGNPALASEKTGTLVFTGMPSGKKHMEFFFFDRKPGSVKVPDDVWVKFIDVHERQEKISETWKWRRAQLHSREENRPVEIPVFFLTDKNGNLTHLGLAMMFKLPADKSIGEMIKNTSEDHRRTDVSDLADRIFGRLEINKGDGWRGRVSFGWAEATGGYIAPEDDDVHVVLAKPKPSFPPAYVRQKDFAQGAWTLLGQDGNAHQKAQYRSYMSHPNPGTAWKEEIRGWKRYPVRPAQERPASPPAGKSGSTLRPLRVAPGQVITFAFHLRYHNLHPVELGALIWAATWGGDDTLRHAVGMGRPFGWGRLKLAANLDAAQTAALSAYQTAMEAWAQAQGMASWAGSIQLRQLRAMADLEIGETATDLLKQMKIVVKGKNDFADAKKAGSILPEYPNHADRRPLPSPGSLNEYKHSVRNDNEKEPVPLRLPVRMPPIAAAIRFKAGDTVVINSGAIRAVGTVQRDTDSNDKTVVRYFKSAKDERANKYPNVVEFRLSELSRKDEPK